MNLEQLRAKRKELADQMSAIADVEAKGTELTEEEATEFETAEAEFKKVDAQTQRAEAVAATRARLKEPRPSAGAIQAVETVEPIIPGGAEAKQAFECFEEFLCAVAIARTGGGGFDPRLVFQPAELRGEQSMGVGTKGGFMVPEEFRAQLLQVDEAQTPLLGSVLRLPPGANPDASVTMPMLDQDTNQQGGVTVARVAEGGAKPETDFDLKQVSWAPTEIAAHIPLTDQLIRNWSGAMGMAQTLLRSAINAALENEIYNGNGVAQMLGILQSGAAYKVNRATANDFTLADVANMAERKLQRGGGAFWLYNQLLLSNLMQMKDGNNNLVWQSSVVPGSPNMLWGLPAIPYEFAAAVGSLGDVALVQPNPYYVVKEGSGPFIDVGFINTDFTTNRRRVKIFLLNDGGPWLQAPFLLQNGTQVSPFVLLDVPA
jgi:HK97 family phage major capsid protein